MGDCSEIPHPRSVACPPPSISSLHYPPSSHSYDAEQLPLGVFDVVVSGADRSPLAVATSDAPSDAPPREPPVCGEWSFDVSDDLDARTASLLAGMAPAPSLTPELRPTTVRSQATSNLPPRPPTATTRSELAAIPSAAVPSAEIPAAVREAPVVTPGAGRTAGESTAAVATPLPALAELKSLHDAQPGDAASATALATALDQRGNIEGALSVLLRAIAAGADGVSLRCARAAILAGRLRYDDAEAELQRAASLRADDTEVLLLRGILACRRAKWREAVEPLTHVVKIDPSSGAAHFYLGEALSRFDRLPDAFASYERATELEPTNWRAWKGAGMVLDRMGRSADAATFYRRARDAQRG